MDRKEIYNLKRDILLCVQTLVGWEIQARKYTDWAANEEHKLQRLIAKLEQKSMDFALQETNLDKIEGADHG